MRITNLRYADDIILLAESAEKLQELVDRLDKVAQEYNLCINIDKTKVMNTNETQCKIYINGEQLEQATSFVYLGSIITEDAECETEIRARLDKGQAVNKTLQNLWKSHDISIKTKIKIWKTLVWPVATYGCETWTMKKDMKQGSRRSR